jgi:hypothetical protein
VKVKGAHEVVGTQSGCPDFGAVLVNRCLEDYWR